MRTKPVLATAAAVLLLTAGCGSGSPSGGDSAEPAASGGDSELTPVTVGVIPIVDTAPIWLGQEQGFFEEEGIELELQTTSGGAAAVPGVVSGDFDFAFGNVMSVMVASSQGLDVRFVANGASTTGDLESDFGAVVVPEDSDIQSAADLEGKRVSVNNLANIGDTTIRYVVEQDGGDQSSIEFVEIGFPDAPAALANDQVDAAWILEPFLSQALADGGRVVSYNYAEMSPDLDIAGYFTTGETIDADADLVERFTAAMNKSLEYAQENPDAVRDIVGTYTEISDELRAEMILPSFTTEFSLDAATTLGEAALEYGTISEAPDLDTILP